MKSIHANVQTKLDTNIGTQPYTTVTITWDTGDVSYTDDDKILGAGNVLSNIKLGMISELQSISVSLDDTDGSLKTKVNTERIEGRKCVIKQCYSGIAETVTVLSGKIIGGITWSEGERQLNFTVESIYESEEIGFAPDEDSGVDEDAVGVPWPICFGNVLHSRTVRIYKSPKLELTQPYNYAQNQLKVKFESGREAPAGEQIIRVGRIRFRGSFDGNIFNITEKNLPYYENVEFAPRIRDDRHFWDANVAWLADSSIRLVGHYCLVKIPAGVWGAGNYMVNQCTGQYKDKVFFIKPWRRGGETLEHRMNPDYDLEEAAPIVRDAWVETYYADVTYDGGGILQNNVPRWVPTGRLVVANMALAKGVFSLSEGSSVFIEQATLDTYVANLEPSLEVKGVFGWRKDENDNRIFAPIPSSYYTVTLNKSILGQTSTIVEFDNPLEFILGEGWEGNVYVTLRSTIGDNITQALEYILDNHTDLTTDATTFELVRSRTLAYPTNFTIYDQPAAIRVAERIAYLGRCALIIRDGTIYIKYLSYSYTADKTLTESNTEYKSITLSSTLTEDIYTKIKAIWRPDYSEREEDREINYENNTDIYGAREHDIDVFIYNNRDLVNKTLAFWGYYYSNSWREVLLSNFLNTLALDNYDVAAVNIPIISSNTIRGFVRDISHNSDNHSIQTKILLASRMGESTADEPIEDDGFWTGDGEISTDDVHPGDPLDDMDEVDYDVPIIKDDDDQSDPDTDGTVGEYQYQIFANPTWIRGKENRLEIVVANNSGVRVNGIHGTAMVTLEDKTDNDDTIYRDISTLSSITIENGYWDYNIVKISGGTGDQTATITVKGALYKDGAWHTVRAASLSIEIIDDVEDELTWTTAPVSVNRSEGFTIALTNGPISGTLPISLSSTDNNDELVDTDGNPVTEITFDGDGDHTSTLMIISGNGTDTGTMTVISPLDEPVSCEPFAIFGVGENQFEHEMEFTDQHDVMMRELVMEKTGNFDDATFEMTVTIKNAFGATDTTFNGWVWLFVDTAGIITVDFGPNAVTSGPKQSAVKLTNGVWTYDSCKLTVSADAPYPRCMSAMDQETQQLKATLCDNLVEFKLTVDNSIFAATTSMSVIQYLNGAVDTSITGNISLTISGTGAALVDLGPNATIHTSTTATLNMVNGVWSYSSCDITGGSATTCLSASKGIMSDSHCETNTFSRMSSGTIRVIEDAWTYTWDDGKYGEWPGDISKGAHPEAPQYMYSVMMPYMLTNNSENIGDFDGLTFSTCRWDRSGTVNHSIRMDAWGARYDVNAIVGSTLVSLVLNTTTYSPSGVTYKWRGGRIAIYTTDTSSIPVLTLSGIQSLPYASVNVAGEYNRPLSQTVVLQRYTYLIPYLLDWNVLNESIRSTSTSYWKDAGFAFTSTVRFGLQY